MAIPAINTTTPQNLPVSLTTNQNTRPVSVRTAQENEIDQLNNTPNAKKLYNARIIGGVIGAAIPLTTAVVLFSKARKNWKPPESKRIKPFFQAVGAIAAAALTFKLSEAGAKLSHALTVFFSTRGKSEAQ